MSDEVGHEPEHPKIFIDRKEFRAHSDEMTGEQIRHLPNPPIGPDRDLWLDVPGGHDKLIGNNEVVELRNGMHFFTAPATINPGLHARTA
jgi:hypothetical protein